MGNSVFLDTSALFAGIRSGMGHARELLSVGGEGRVDLCISPDVVDECRRNLDRKGTPVDVTFLDLLIAEEVLRLVHPAPSLITHVAQSIEFKDAPIVAAAITANTPMLATYDQRHLLSRAAEIKAAFGVEVLTPEEVLGRLVEPGP